MLDATLRQAAFDWLAEQVALHGEVLPRNLLARGFALEGEFIPLVSPQGIFKPRRMESPLSITSAPESPYRNSLGADQLLHYQYRGIDPNHRDNVGLRGAMVRRVPLVYFHGIVPGKYLPLWPVFVVGDDPKLLFFRIELDDDTALRKLADPFTMSDSIDVETPIRRGYLTAIAKDRIHQQAFRERVITAYQRQCALCGLKHDELLDAAHIVADSNPEGEPLVANGIALCKLHHAAFDRYFLSVRSDYIIQIRNDVLVESDAPMLKHGLQGLHDKQIYIPSKMSHRPNRNFLDRRHLRFLELAFPDPIAGRF
jgi:putative restriction endonuclease